MSRPRGAPRMIVRRSVLTGLVAVSLAAVAAFPLYTVLIVGPAFSRLLADSARMEAERTAAHLAEPFFDDIGLIRREQLTPAFRATMARHLRAFQLERLKVFAPSGEIVFSTSPPEEGMVNAKPYFREVVATGTTRTSVVHRHGRTQEGRIEELDVVETYAPVVRNGKVVGVFEIYYDISARTEKLERLLLRTNLTMLLMAGALLAALVFATLRAGRTLRERDRTAEALRELFKPPQ